MKIFKSLALAASMAFLSTAASATDDQTGFQFTDGSVLIHCVMAKAEDDITVEVFNAAYPTWISNLQQLANDGKVARAHYLGEVKKGIFIVVLGEDRDEAMTNAEAIVSDNMKTLEEGAKVAGVTLNDAQKNSCNLLEIGPVAVLPQ